MKEKFEKGVAFVLGKKAYSADSTLKSLEVNNTAIRLKQLRALVAGLLIVFLIIGSVTLFVKQKAEARSKPPAEDQVLTVELPDRTLDPEKHWRNYTEETLAKTLKEIEKKLQKLEELEAQMITKTNQRIEEKLAETEEKLAIAQQELSGASLELQRVARMNEKQSLEAPHALVELGEQEFDQEVEFDRPKSAKNYIPEGIYFTGHLLGGLAVSTGLNTPDENAPPIVIQLMPRIDPLTNKETTNLSPLNKIDLGNCIIRGSSYGDLSSERAIIRLEKMVCLEGEVYVTSYIAGQAFGPDGLNGIKGTVISTASKLIKNAAIGGFISGISSAGKGQDIATISGSGLIQTTKKETKDLLGNGALQGVSNSGDKIADYYLRQAEAMSPILTIPSGVRVNTQITKGFFVGEVSTHKRIKDARLGNSNARTNSRNSNSSLSSNYSTSNIPEDTKSEYSQ